MHTFQRRNGFQAERTSLIGRTQPIESKHWGTLLARASALGLLITGISACKTMETVVEVANTAAQVLPAVQGNKNSNGNAQQPQSGGQTTAYPANLPAQNVPPVACAGQDLYITQPSIITLDASCSQDANGDELGYQWALQAPAGSQARLDDPTSRNPSFTADVNGVYSANLVVRDHSKFSQNDTVNITLKAATPYDARRLPQNLPVVVSKPTAQPLPQPTPTQMPAPISTEDVAANIPSAPAPSDDTTSEVATNASAPIEVNPDDPDGDNLNAQWEEAFAYSATERDSDKDGITDDKEDYDGDTWANLVEITEGFDPKNPKNHPIGLADMVSFELDQTPVAAGGRLGYTITLGNLLANRSLNNVQVMMRIPKGISLHYSLDAEPDINGNVGCYGYACEDGDEISWKLDSLAPGESRTILVNANVAAEVMANSSIETSLRVSADGFNTLSQKRITGVVAKQPVQFTLTPSTDPVAPGESFSYTLNLGNAGNNALGNTELKLALPEGLTVGAISDGGKNENNVITWPAGSVSPGASLQRSVSVTLAQDAQEAATLGAIAQLRHDGGTELDRERRASVTVSERLPLDLRFEQAQTPVTNAGILTYLLHVGNTASVSTLNDVEVTMRVPKGLSFHYSLNAEPDIRGNVGCYGYACDAGDEVSWKIDRLAPGESQSIQVNMTVDAADTFNPGSLIQAPITVTATGLGDVIHQVRTTAVTAKPPVHLTLSPSAEPVAPGASFIYTLDLGNAGNTALNSSKITLQLPAGVTAASISDGGTQSGNMVTWDAGNVAAGSALKRTVNATLSADAVEGASVDAIAQVRHDGGLELDRESHAQTTVSAPLPLSVNYRIDETSIKAGGIIKYMLELTNSNSVSTFNNVEVLMRLPIGTSFHYAQNAEPDISGNVGCYGYACTGGDEVFWKLGNLAPGAQKTIEVEAKVDVAVTPGTLIQTPVTITADGLGDVITEVRTVHIVAP